MQPAAPSNTSSVSAIMHKNRLQEYTQRSALPFPSYLTVNEGAPHAPKFRSSVTVGGATYKSSYTFLHRKEAEQNAAKLALECIFKNIKDEGCPPIYEDPVLCKSILNEFAVKLNIEKPTYTTTQSEAIPPVFVSSLVFNGKAYSGGAGKNKKEAEQLAARTVIQSILGSGSGSGSGPLLSQIIKSKAKLYAALHTPKDYGNGSVSMGINLVFGASTGTEKAVHDSNPSPIVAGSEPAGKFNHVTVTPLPKRPKLEPSCGTTTCSNGNVTPLLDQPLCSGQAGLLCWSPGSVSGAQGVIVSTSTGGKRSRKKNKKRGHQNIMIGEPLQEGVFPTNQSPSCSVAL